MSELVLISVTAYGLAPPGARPSVGKVITKFGSCIFTGPALEKIITSHACYMQYQHSQG